MQKKHYSNIDNLRKKIDILDQKIINLLHKRLGIVKNIKKLKNTNNIHIYSPKREAFIINKLIKNNKNIFPEKSLLKIYSEIFSASRKLQKNLKIGFLGPESTFSHIAAENIFGLQSDYIALNSFKAVFTELETTQIDYGVVPIENSNEGVVGYTLDLLIEYNHYIIQEFYLEITNNIISKENSINKIKTLYSHPQPLGQCRIFIENNLKNVRIIKTSSTAEAALLCSTKKNSAAISSIKAAEKYHLNVLSEKINDNLNNFTRFIVLSKTPNKIIKKSEYKSSLVIGVKDKAGALFSILKPFNKYKINMTKIESRPTRKKAWEYIFFIEFIGHPGSSNIKNAIIEIQNLSTYFKQLGYYPICKHVL